MINKKKLNKEDLKRWVSEARMQSEFPQHRAHGMYGNPRIDRNSETICKDCGVEFVCDINAGKDACWCFDYPNIIKKSKSKVCLCKNCLVVQLESEKSE